MPNDKYLYVVDDLYFDTYSFNNIAGNLEDVDQSSLDSQMEFIKEEVNEFIKGHNEKNLVETCDGIVDTLVTVFGYMQKLESIYGIDWGDIMEAVALNNLSKFPESEQIAIETVEYYKTQGIDTYYEYNQDYSRYVIKDSKTHKVKKPLGFTSVDLKPFMPVLH